MKNLLKKIIRAWKAFREPEVKWNSTKVKKIMIDVKPAFMKEMKAEASEIARGAHMRINEHMDKYLVKIIKKHLGEQLFQMYEADRSPMPFLKVRVEPFTNIEACIFGQTMKIWIRDALVGDAKFTAHVQGGTVRLDVEEVIT